MTCKPIHPDVVSNPKPEAVQLKGLLGERCAASRNNRLLPHEDYYYLWPFREHCRVGWNNNPPHPAITKGDWQGEFMGTYVAAASLAAANAGDEKLRAKLDNLVREWLACQEADGYLGTYDEPDRWKSWDVWVQAHDLIGLLTYHEVFGSDEALRAAVRVADHLLADFGPGRRSLGETGPHGGMASSAIVEPMCWLYWRTGDARYLDFARWIVEVDWEKPKGPAILSSIRKGKGVAGVATGKAAEMLICFIGIVELYRATGEEGLLESVLAAWDDIVRHQLYITGSASTGEYFMSNYLLKNDGQFNIGETCVTMTWLYLNLSLGRLTGEARFFDMAEQSIYNHLLAAQSPDGSCWTYYAGLRDNKRYRWHTDPDCCPSRGIRALSVLPQHAFGLARDGVMVNLYDPCDVTLTLTSGAKVGLTLQGSYPFDGTVRVSVHPEKPEAFTLLLRAPGWCPDIGLKVNGASQTIDADAKGYLVLTRTWKKGDTVELAMDMPVRAVADSIGNPGRVAITRGPLVYALDSSFLPDGTTVDDVRLSLVPGNLSGGIRIVQHDGATAPYLAARSAWRKPELGEGLWREPERYHVISACGSRQEESEVTLVPFYDAGNRDPAHTKRSTASNTEPGKSVTYQVWLPYVCG